jgi:hypothetical protein
VEFADLVQNDPHANVVAALYFMDEMPADDVVNSLHEGHLQVRSFSHGTSTSSGGYILQDGETVEEAVTAYKRDHGSFLDLEVEQLRQMIASERNQELREAFKTRQQEVIQRRGDFNAKGLSIIAVEVRGQAYEIDRYRQVHGFVRVVEIKKPNVPQPAIPPQR